MYDESTETVGFSPYGRLVAFASDREDSLHLRLYVAPATGGKARAVSAPRPGLRPALGARRPFAVLRERGVHRHQDRRRQRSRARRRHRRGGHRGLRRPLADPASRRRSRTPARPRTLGCGARARAADRLPRRRRPALRSHGDPRGVRGHRLHGPGEPPAVGDRARRARDRAPDGADPPPRGPGRRAQLHARRYFHRVRVAARRQGEPVGDGSRRRLAATVDHRRRPRHQPRRRRRRPHARVRHPDPAVAAVRAVAQRVASPHRVVGGRDTRHARQPGRPRPRLSVGPPRQDLDRVAVARPR